MRIRFALGWTTTLFLGPALAAPTAAQETILVQNVVSVTVARDSGALVVTAAGTVPIAGFAKPALKPRPDLVRVEGGYVLDFVAAAPPRGLG